MMVATIRFKEELFLKKLSRKLYWEVINGAVKVEKAKRFVQFLHKTVINFFNKKIRFVKFTEHFALRFSESEISFSNLEKLIRVSTKIVDNPELKKEYEKKGYKFLPGWGGRMEVRLPNNKGYVVFKTWEENPHIDFISCGIPGERIREREKFNKFGLKNFEKRKIIKAQKNKN